MKISPKGQKWLKILHLLFACCWIGGALSLAILYFAKIGLEDSAQLYGVNSAIHLIDMGIVVVCGALGCFFTGLFYSIVTKWGFFKHRWIILKWILTLVCIVFGTFVLGPMEKEFLQMSKEGLTSINSTEYKFVEDWQFYLGSLQIAVLLFFLYLSVIKPPLKRKEKKA